MSNKLTARDYCEAAKILNCSVAAIKAVAQVESGGRGGFDERERVILRFEGHKFREFTGGKYDKSHPQISHAYHGSHKNCGKLHGYSGFSQAFALNPLAAMKACSIGMFQPMVFNHHEMGYSTVSEMFDDFKKGEREQLLAFVRLIVDWGLDDELRRAKLADFTTFARMYNGKKYADNNYHNKMNDNYKTFSKQNIDCKSLLLELDDNDITDFAATIGEHAYEPLPVIESEAEQIKDFSHAVNDFGYPVGDQVGGFVNNQIGEIGDKAESTIGEIKETFTEKTQEAGREIEKTTSEITNTFTPQNLPAFIPRFGKQWLYGLFPGAGLVSTIVAYVENAPQWMIFVFGVITGITAYGFFQLVIKHREIVGQFLINCYKSMADPQSHNLIPTQASQILGKSLFNNLKGSRRAEIERSLEV